MLIPIINQYTDNLSGISVVLTFIYFIIIIGMIIVLQK